MSLHANSPASQSTGAQACKFASSQVRKLINLSIFSIDLMIYIAIGAFSWLCSGLP
jgi:hypothetical protein